jgi:hypothetical protein
MNSKKYASQHATIPGPLARCLAVSKAFAFGVATRIANAEKTTIAVPSMNKTQKHVSHAATIS